MDGDSEIEIANANNQFSSNFYKILSKKSVNVFFSPLSAHACLSMTYQGAAGTTKEAFEKVLHISGPSVAAEGYNAIMNSLNNAENITLLMANKAYVMAGRHLSSNFENVVREQFQAEVDVLNFIESATAAKMINSWVNDKTNGKIERLFDSDEFDRYTRLVLVNVIYFKGDWALQFHSGDTRKETFYVDDDHKVDCQMMHMKKKCLYKLDENLDAQVLELPYKNKQFSMVVILPNEKNGITELETKLLNYDLTKTTESMLEKEVIVALPKFKIEQQIDLQETLKGMGLGELFDEDKCDLPNIIEEKEKLFVSKAIQKVFIEVNEVGSEAAAATGNCIKRKYAAWTVENIEFIADHPFVIILMYKYENRHIVLYFGKLLCPNTNNLPIVDTETSDINN